MEATGSSPVDLVKKQAVQNGQPVFLCMRGSKLCGRRMRRLGASEAKPARKGDLPLEPRRASPVCKLREAFAARRPAGGPTKGRRKGEPRMLRSRGGLEAYDAHVTHNAHDAYKTLTLNYPSFGNNFLNKYTLPLNEWGFV